MLDSVFPDWDSRTNSMFTDELQNRVFSSNPKDYLLYNESMLIVLFPPHGTKENSLLIDKKDSFTKLNLKNQRKE